MDSADYVIAGGGSAGCVLAHRLSENPNNRVVLLEAGGSNERFWVNAPAGFTRLTANPETNWMYRTEPDPTLGGRQVIWHGGKLLGGGSSINGMAYIRGARYDYDAWAEQGCSGWSWNEVMPYFLRAEDFDGEPSQSHGSTGPLGVSHHRILHPLAGAFLGACGQVGMRQLDDYCGGDIDGAFYNFDTIKQGQRSSTAASYLKAAKGRPNLEVVTGAMVDRVVFEGDRATGVAYRKDGAEHIVRAGREVIVCAGALQSPGVLLRSGIGPAEHLKSMGVEVRKDRANVGRNLHEHASIHSSRLVSITTYNAIRNPIRLAAEGLNYLLFRRGILTTGAVHAMAHAKSRPDMPHPDIKLQMLPFCATPPAGKKQSESGITISINGMFPKARGEIRLRSTNPADKPVIDYKMYEHPEDLDVMRAGMRLADRIFESPALAQYVTGPLIPPTPNPSDEELDALIRARSNTGLHPVSSCRMGADAESVVDPQLRVRGVGSLRVIDASVMPVLPSANTNAPTIMIAEKGADMILASARA